MRVSDVVVVGGGPAGLYAAWNLARAGCDVTLLEEHADIGEPVHCTGVLAKDAFEEFSLDTCDVLNELTTVRFHAPSGHTIEYSTRSVEAVVIDRAAFDRRLAGEAVRAGVRMVNGRAMAVNVDPDGVTVSAGATSVRGRACVLACGASYAMQRDLGLGMPKLLMRSAQVELPADRLGDVEVYFGRNLAPGGFAWAVPVSRGDRACVRVGVMCHTDASRHFQRVLEQVAPRWGIPRLPVPQPRQKILPLEPIQRTYADRLLVVGDAAGLVKPTTGGGSYYSLLTASLAAETLAQALDRDDLGAERLSHYEMSWRQRLDPELRSQMLLRRIAQRLSDADIDGLFELASADGIVPLIRQTAAFNHHREFIVALLKHPPARRLLFRAAFA
jgi:digeranylgeranylglycerophospholipid reductase